MRILASLLFAVSSALGADLDRDGLEDLDELSLGTSPRNADTDGDGLLDGWEVLGRRALGFEEPLFAYGADPLEKDIFVEIDWMETIDGDPRVGAAIAYQAAVDIVRVFRRSGTGIRIHFDLGPEIESLVPPELIESDVDFAAFREAPDERKVLPYQEAFPSRPSPGIATSRLSLYDVYYGGYYFRPSRRNVFYYVLIAEARDPFAALGDAQDPTKRAFSDAFADQSASRDSLADAGVRACVVYRKPVPELFPAGTRYFYSVSVLHELGHAFGLGHGGSLPDHAWDNTNYKPNYPSIMNYRYQFCGVGLSADGPVMDFSHGLLSLPLDERRLMEAEGMGALVSEHILRCSGFSRLPSAEHPHNIDWNGDGRLDLAPVVADLNGDGRINSTPHRDHDDWGKFVREGFDGIGTAAFRGRRKGPDAIEQILVLPGDYDGDKRTDLFLLAGTRLAFALARGDGELSVQARSPESGMLGAWRVGPAATFSAGDFFGLGRDMVFAHRGEELAVLELDAGAPGVRWYGDGTVRGASQEAGGIWQAQASDRFLPAKLDPAVESVVAANGKSLGILRASADDSFGLYLVWSGQETVEAVTSPVGLRAGAASSGGTQTVLVDAPRALFGLSGPATDPKWSRLDRNGWLPWRSDVPAESREGWELSASDLFFHIDLDGDGSEETVLHRADSLGVVFWESGQPRLVWKAEGKVGELWPISETDRLYAGQFVPGGGKELLISNGYSWLTLAWNQRTLSLQIIGFNNGYLADATPGWELAPGQAVFVGRFLPAEADTVCVKNGTGLAVAQFYKDRFIPMLRIDGRVGPWILDPADRLTPGEFDGDPGLEFLVRRGSVWGILDFTPAPRCTFLGRLNLDELLFEPEPAFRRGDANFDGSVDISDAAAILNDLFLGLPAVLCRDGADADDNGSLEITDAILLLLFLFDKGRPPAAPGPFRPGIDPTFDALDCVPAGGR